MTQTAWWNTAYPYRRNLEIIAPAGGLVTGSNITFSIPVASTIALGKVRTDLRDLIVAYIDQTAATPSWVVLDSSASIQGTNVIVQFPLYADLPATRISQHYYYLHYGNPTLAATPTLPTYTPNFWPYKVAWDQTGISYTRPGEHWENGVSKAVGAKMTFPFYGSDVQLISNKGVNLGILSVSVDNGPPTLVDLFSLNSQPKVAVFTANNLSNTSQHILRVVATGQKNPSAIANHINVVQVNSQKQTAAIDMGEEINSSLWSTSTGGST